MSQVNTVVPQAKEENRKEHGRFVEAESFGYAEANKLFLPPPPFSGSHTNSDGLAAGKKTLGPLMNAR